MYAMDLSPYELPYIAPVLEDIGKEAPQDYKQLWPAIGTILEAIRGRIRASRSEQTSADRWAAYVEAYKEERMFDDAGNETQG